ncbi:longevity assurance proteins LAG1/LAC1 [Teratosphaeria nubilosa]|uniref:Longevity assurance proteins LAG1/LAC1 n=1 Tax=Teratosphaeria nubilosa TaxID=161662 RepID=A0A6G1L4B4_9PEZI|nr:longevity assurance proteins LAG1/LAC1 [Teratosphaeria nubilosa]
MGTTTRRRKNSSLGADPRGDTGAGAIATNLPQQRAEASGPSSSSAGGAGGGGARKGGREQKRTRAKKLLRRWKRTCLKHTWLLPLLLILLVLAAYVAAPGPRNPLHYALFLAYAHPALAERTHTLPAHIGDVTQYGKGPLDLAFVAFYTVVFTFTREFLMQRLIKPIAIWNGIKNRGKQARFMEQFYTAIYFAVFGPLGLWIMRRTPVWYFNIPGMYEGFPHRAHEALFKAYYLLQASYWAQQAIVLMLQLEKPRKDFKELVLHHVVTLALIGLSYCFHFTYMGIAVYVTHDISDFFLATSKCLNYIDSFLTGPFFALFVLIWAYLRHYINLTILKSLLYPPTTFHIPFTNLTLTTGEFATVGPYTLDWETQQYKCWLSQPITFALLAALQLVNMVWFFLILRILARYVFKGVQKDERSEDEEEEEEEREDGEWEKSDGTPRIAVNGRVIGSEAPSTGVQARGKEDVVRRKSSRAH